MDNDINEKAQNLVKNEVYLNQSALVEHLQEISGYENGENTYYTIEECEAREYSEEETEEILDEYKEIFEWWAVSDWLADKLDQEFEPILRNEFGTWWGRTTSGQMIYLDSVVQRIVK